MFDNQFLAKLKKDKCQMAVHTFLLESALHIFSLITVWLCGDVLQNNIGAKCKMLMKLTTGALQSQIVVDIYYNGLNLLSQNI